MLIFEDLHWIDEETQAFLNLLAEGIANAPVLLLVNYRPEYRHQWGERGLADSPVVYECSVGGVQFSQLISPFAVPNHSMAARNSASHDG